MNVIIERTDRYRVTSYGNGVAYLFDDLKGKEGFVQGDDALQWRNKYETMQSAYDNPKSVWHKRTWNRCLAELIEPYLDHPWVTI